MQVELSFLNIPTISEESLAGLRLECELYGEGYSRRSDAVVKDEININCMPFDPPPQLESNVSVQEAMVSIVFSYLGIDVNGKRKCLNGITTA